MTDPIDPFAIWQQTFDGREVAQEAIEKELEEIRLTPGFFRRKSSKPPVGSMSLFEMDEPTRGEYD